MHFIFIILPYFSPDLKDAKHSNFNFIPTTLGAVCYFACLLVPYSTISAYDLSSRFRMDPLVGWIMCSLAFHIQQLLRVRTPRFPQGCLLIFVSYQETPPAAPPILGARNISGRSIHSTQGPLSPLSGPVLTGDDDVLFSMDG